uniref:Uncharacterized protein n=1 Tax=Rhizophora mucronata TaxID=61149 RepID=A0A2P2R260_RHIMU
MISFACAFAFSCVVYQIL